MSSSTPRRSAASSTCREIVSPTLPICRQNTLMRTENATQRQVFICVDLCDLWVVFETTQPIERTNSFIFSKASPIEFTLHSNGW